jgi:hypothetical protein
MRIVWNLFFPTKKPLEGCRSRSETQGHPVLQWFQQQLKEFFIEEIHQLVCKWDACLKMLGGFLMASTLLLRSILEWFFI